MGLQESEICCVIFDISQAIEYLHRKDIIHRDIKPENILIGCTDKRSSHRIFKLCDLGFAVELDGRTSVRTKKGTLFYLVCELHFKKRNVMKTNRFQFQSCMRVYNCMEQWRHFMSLLLAADNLRLVVVVAVNLYLGT